MAGGWLASQTPRSQTRTSLVNTSLVNTALVNTSLVNVNTARAHRIAEHPNILVTHYTKRSRAGKPLCHSVM